MGALAQTRTGADVGIFRITRTVMSGVFADDACVQEWLKANSALHVVKQEYEGDNPASQRRYILWHQADAVQTPKDCALSLVTSNGKNGWATQSEAEAVLDGIQGRAAAVDAAVESANANSYLQSVLHDFGPEGEPASQWSWVKWVVGGSVVVAGIYSVAKLVRG